MSENAWPEQEATDRWWQENSFKLKKAVTEYRLELQRTNTSLLKVCNRLIEETTAVLVLLPCKAYELEKARDDAVEIIKNATDTMD